MDESRRVRLFHGFNDVGQSKGTGHTPGGADYLPKVVLNASDFNDTATMDELAADGFNVMRLPMMWAAVSPSPDEFDEKYLSTMQIVLDRLAVQGMYGFLDMHQDVLSSSLGGYDGAPLWVVNQTQPRKPYPWPLKEPLSNWAFGYVSEATGQAFQDIYDNTYGGLDAWAAFWKKVAEFFRGRPQVLGYELMNEPWVGDMYRHPALVLPAEAGRRTLMPSYNVVANAIREVDDETIIMFEPMQGVALSSSGELGSGFTTVPGGPQYANRSCLSWHYYCFFLNSDYVNSSSPMPPFSKTACHRGMGPQVFRSAVKDAETLQIATLLTEFGALVPDSTEPHAQGSEEIEWVLEQADATLQGWTYWDIVGLLNRGTGRLDAAKLDLFVRAYASAVAGIPETMRFDRASSKFDLTFQADTSISAPTEIVLPAKRYAHGFTVELSEGLEARPCSRASQTLCVYFTPSAVSGPASISVSAKAGEELVV